MQLNHLILTEAGFVPPNWEQGLKPLVIKPHAMGEAPQLDISEQTTVAWVLSSVPGWEQLVRAYSARCPVLVLTKLSKLSEMQMALEAGARGYVEALAHPTQLKQAAAAVQQGALWIAAPMLSRLLGILSQKLPEAQVPRRWAEVLSKREQQVAELVTTGISNREVADQLHICVRTVKEHLTSIFAKLEVQDRLHLVLQARQGGQS